ncbi:hypothetical protein AVEN_7952-1 [Araneus ventricosus]|uniref:Uncharacterized protein n=1 Tax=Araneus ventricosus TaxID=182803 RepID=A0A4Y2D1P9_ARAVE|nr:hypothetical protein AVEN_7952-1 [Araneus ventricosus]
MTIPARGFNNVWTVLSEKSSLCCCGPESYAGPETGGALKQPWGTLLTLRFKEERPCFFPDPRGALLEQILRRWRRAELHRKQRSTRMRAEGFACATSSFSKHLMDSSYSRGRRTAFLTINGLSGFLLWPGSLHPCVPHWEAVRGSTVEGGEPLPTILIVPCNI